MLGRPLERGFAAAAKVPRLVRDYRTLLGLGIAIPQVNWSAVVPSFCRLTSRSLGYLQRDCSTSRDLEGNGMLTTHSAQAELFTHTQFGQLKVSQFLQRNL